MNYSYKGYTIEKLTKKDWIIYRDGQFAPMNGFRMKGSDGTYARNAMTLKEAKQRIDNA